MTPLAIAFGGLVLASLGYLLNRRINQAVTWSATQQRGQHDTSVIVTNTGTSKARGVTVELNGTPTLHDDEPRDPVDVDRGATVIIGYFMALGGRPPSQVTVRWSRRLRRDGVWTTPI